ncbi:MAG: ATPase domain-containing protein [Candidatus Bathyarchaeota archaeon]|jgi:DNA repair protein RadB|nr:ATPase domain-containing protein [Candidatus Bathyarchaeota archaeon]
MRLQNKIATGCDSIDKLLEGGISRGSISLVYGEPETGKTTLAMQCAVNCTRQGLKALFADCDATFHPRRLAQIAGEELEKASELIVLMKPTRFREQTAIIDRLVEYTSKNFGLVVFDTITSLYRLETAEAPAKTFDLNRELNRQIAVLAQTAKTQQIAVLLTSQVRTAFVQATASIEPVATRVLKFWAETIINMKPTEKPGIVHAILEKSLRKIPPQTYYLRIRENGIFSCSNL